MEQLPLDVQLADYAVFESFFTGNNEAPVAALADLAASVQRSVVWLWGAPDSGKSHLLQACAAAASQPSH